MLTLKRGPAVRAGMGLYMRTSRIMPVLALLIAGSVSLLAQVTGQMTGSVTDPVGAVVPDAKITVYLTGGQRPVIETKTNQKYLKF